MGMFDYVRCEYPLPVVEGANELSYQTKDLECTLFTYVIRKDGRVYIRESSKTYDGSVVMRFYTTLGKDHSGWLEFEAIVIDGFLHRVQLVKHQEAANNC